MGPVCIRPPPLHSPVSNPGPPEAGMCTTRMQRLEATFRTTMAFTLRVLGGRLCSRVRPGGRLCRGTFSRTEERSSSISVLVVCMIAGIVYDYRYQGHTIEERWTSIVMTVILLSSIRVGPLLIHVLTLFDRCPWYMRQNKSVYDTASEPLAFHATLGETTTHA